MQPLIAAAPKITEHLDAESADHYAQLQDLLSAAGVKFVLNPRLVRGLDYYSRTVFEWVTDRLGAQGAVGAGGRYDGLVEHLGGKPTPAVGWALGIERLVELYKLEAADDLPRSDPDVYIVAVGEAANSQALLLAEQLRNADAGLRVEVNCGGGSYKSQFKRADKSGAALALILGEEEISQQQVGIKTLRTESEQLAVDWQHAAEKIREQLQ